jgi:membrane-associated PAP2 superfamily phosphatase
MVVSAFFLIWLGNFTNLDMRLAESMYDTRTGSFPWRHAWLTEHFGHVIAKQILIALALIPVVLCLSDSLLRPQVLPAWWRLRIRIVAACAVAIPGLTALLKKASSSHCPWDLQGFGGNEPYYRLLDHVPAWVEAGKCLPGGHASSALWLIGLAVFWLPHRPRVALMMAGLLALPGLALGWMQQMRGAHFLTHNLWSLWIACIVMMAVLELAQWRSLGLPRHASARKAAT